MSTIISHPFVESHTSQIDRAQSNRIECIDIARGIAMFCVIVGHNLPETSSVNRIILSFHMPLFFIISGTLLSNRNTAGLIKFFKNQLTRLMLPQVILGIFEFVFQIIYQSLFKGECFREVLSLELLFTSVLKWWFLIVLFEVNLLSYFFKKYLAHKWYHECPVKLRTLLNKV